MLLALLLILQAQFPGAALAGHPAATLTWAERRAEAPHPQRGADSLRSLLRTRPDDPAARLALGTLERFLGQAKAARADLELVANRAGDAWASAARASAERGSRPTPSCAVVMAFSGSPRAAVTQARSACTSAGSGVARGLSAESKDSARW